MEVRNHEFAAATRNPLRLGRVQGETRVLASLDHPDVANFHGRSGDAYTLVGLSVLTIAQLALERQAAAQSGATVEAPRFEVDPLWPKPLPNHWLLGSTIGVSVDRDDHVWIVHRGDSTLNENERGASLTPPTSQCCKAAPPILEFDQAGNLLRHWGGPGVGYEWPLSNHGVTVDAKQNVWIGGNDVNDGQVLKFTKDGKFLMQVGFGWSHSGSNDTWAFHQVAKISVDTPNNEAYISDGYPLRCILLT